MVISTHTWLESDDFFPSYHNLPCPSAPSIIASHRIIGRAMAWMP